MFDTTVARRSLYYINEDQYQQSPNKRMKLTQQQVTTNSNKTKKRVHFQEVVETRVHERLPQHEAVRLWYCREELQAIHKDIFVCLMESKNGKNLSDFEFSARGLEEIRKRKPHKRQIRRDEYISSVVALHKKQRSVNAVVSPEDIQRFAMPQSRSAKLRAQHYASLDFDEARAIYQETFCNSNSNNNSFVVPATASPTTTTIAKTDISSSSSSRMMMPPFPSTISRTQDSIARSA